MIENLVVVASHGKEHIDKCRESLGDQYEVLVLDEDMMPFPGYTTGKYLWAYWNYPAKNYLFIQDSMEALSDEDYIMPFWEKGSPCAWVVFSMFWDSPKQKELGTHYFEGEPPEQGIFGPVFYVSRKHLDILRDKQLLPPIPVNKEQAQASERFWAWAFANAGIEVKALHPFSKDSMQTGLTPFKKTFADRQ